MTQRISFTISLSHDSRQYNRVFVEDTATVLALHKSVRVHFRKQEVSKKILSGFTPTIVRDVKLQHLCVGHTAYNDNR